MATFVLVHGAWHGAWCWRDLIPYLAGQGHRVVAPDLAGLGEDRTPLREATVARWADDIAGVVSAEDEPVVLVGHSRGGLVISEVAERVPERIAALVYLAAALVPNGQAMLDMFQLFPGPTAADLTEIDPALGGMTVREAMIEPTFYNRCSPEQVAFAKARLRPEPLSSTVTPLRLSDERFGRVPREFIECLQDNALVIGLQRAMQAQLPCRAVHTMDTDHSPFFSAPAELAGILDRIARG